MAAKRSRDARRMKENQIALRAGFLEKEVFNSYNGTNIIKRISTKLINCSGCNRGGPHRSNSKRNPVFKIKSKQNRLILPNLFHRIYRFIFKHLIIFLSRTMITLYEKH